MCGILAYVGDKQKVLTLLSLLRKLEYRGYDSWGVSIRRGNKVVIRKKTGRVSETFVTSQTDMALGHTRWATEGAVTKQNSHPHAGCSQHLALVHNGEILNFRALKERMMAQGHSFASQTDSEVVIHMVEEELSTGKSLRDAAAAVFAQLEGYNAIIIMDTRGRQIVGISNGTPLLVGTDGVHQALASDTLAFSGLATHYYRLESGESVVLNLGKPIELYTTDGQPISPQFEELNVAELSTDLKGFNHYLPKEVADQPEVIAALPDCARQEIYQLAAAIRQSNRVIFTGCGTSEHAAMSGAKFFRTIANRIIETVPGSEFKYEAKLIGPGCLVVALSQSGETADMIKAVAVAKKQGARVAALINVRGSTLDHMVDMRVHMRAGPEICVLSTKDYTAKLAALLLTAYATVDQYEEGVSRIHEAARAMRTMLANKQWTNQLQTTAETICDQEHLFVLGSDHGVPTAKEAALKIKEVTYRHAEDFAAGELKHGVIALTDQGTPFLVFAPRDDTRTDMIKAAGEVKTRGAYIIGVGPTDPVFDMTIECPDLGIANPIIQAPVGQLLGYYWALLLGNNPDRPRNLAKSVTV